MKPSRVFIFINGILSWPGDHEGWTDRAVTWTMTRTDGRAEKWEYACGPILRRLGQEARARAIAVLMRFYQDRGFELVLVGHSNGCDIIARVLDLRGTERWFYSGPVRSVHLFSPAADAADFISALQEDRVEYLHLYPAGKDRALLLGSWTRTLFGWLGLGYGSLGLNPLGRELLPESLLNDPRLTINPEPDYGHSDWFTRGENFERTMLALQENEAAHA